MGWQERFRNIRLLADEKLRKEEEQIRHERENAESVIITRRKLVRSLTPRMEKVCKQFNHAVKGRMRPYRVESWSKGNVGWRLQMNFGGIGIETWPWLHDANKPRLLRGIWTQYLGPDGEELVSESGVKGQELAHYYELGRDGASASGYYYWIPTDYAGDFCVLGYYLAREDFNEETLASILEDIGLDLVQRLTHADFSRIG